MSPPLNPEVLPELPDASDLKIYLHGTFIFAFHHFPPCNFLEANSNANSDFSQVQCGQTRPRLEQAISWSCSLEDLIT